METARFGVALAAASGLLLQSLVPPKTWAAPEPITETLLDQPSGAPAAGRLWPGFAAGKGLDTGAKAEPSGAAPAPITMSLTAPGLGADTGGDLSAASVPWIGTGAAVPVTPPTTPLVGGVPTSGGISLGGGSPLGAGMNLPNFGNLAAGLLAPTISGIPGMPNAGGLAGLGSLGQIPGLQGLGSMMGMVGMLSILNSLPQIIGQFPQMTQQIVQSIGQMSLSIFQNSLGAVNGLAGNYQGLMGMGGQLGQASWGAQAGEFDDDVGRGGGDSSAEAADNLRSSDSTTPNITKNSLPLHPSKLPPVIIGVGHADPVSNKVVSGSLKNLSKIGYKIYGVELPPEYQPGINAFVSVYDKTKNIKQAKEAYWKSQYGSDWDPSTADPYGYQDSGLERMAVARDLGMDIEAIDAPRSKILVMEDKINNSGLQQQVEEQGVTSAVSDSLKQLVLGDERNAYLAGNLKPGMVAEVGYLHTDGPKSVNDWAAISGKQPIGFDAYSPRFSPLTENSSYGGVVLTKPPSVQTMLDTLNNSPKK